MSKLNSRQIKFCEQYILDLNGSQAAIRAGYSEKSARSISSELLDNPLVQKKIQELIEKRSKNTQITSEEVLREIYKSAMVDVTEAFTPDGRVKPFSGMTSELKRAIAGVKMNDYGEITEIKFNPKLKALELLGKHLGLFTEKLEIKADESLEALLAEIGKPHESSGGR